MRRGRIGQRLGYILIAVLLIVMAGRSSPFGGDGGPYILQHDLRIDPARGLISAVRQAIQRFRSTPVADGRVHQLNVRRISDADSGQTP